MKRLPSTFSAATEEAVSAMRRMREILSDYHSTLLGIATQTEGRAAQAARRALERYSAPERRTGKRPRTDDDEDL